jgi:hypothetical protein
MMTLVFGEGNLLEMRGQDRPYADLKLLECVGNVTGKEHEHLRNEFSTVFTAGMTCSYIPMLKKATEGVHRIVYTVSFPLTFTWIHLCRSPTS